MILIRVGYGLRNSGFLIMDIFLVLLKYHTEIVRLRKIVAYLFLCFVYIILGVAYLGHKSLHIRYAHTHEHIRYIYTILICKLHITIVEHRIEEMIYYLGLLGKCSCIANIIENAGIVALRKDYLRGRIQHVEQILARNLAAHQLIGYLKALCETLVIADHPPAAVNFNWCLYR